MKSTALLFLLPALALAHPDPGTKPGADIDQPVHTGNGAWQYEAVPHWGELPDGKNVGPTHGGVVIDEKTSRRSARASTRWRSARSRARR